MIYTGYIDNFPALFNSRGQYALIPEGYRITATQMEIIGVTRDAPIPKEKAGHFIAAADLHWGQIMEYNKIGISSAMDPRTSRKSFIGGY